MLAYTHSMAVVNELFKNNRKLGQQGETKKHTRTTTSGPPPEYDSAGGAAAAAAVVIFFFFFLLGFSMVTFADVL